jgi:hypothetical protein
VKFAGKHFQSLRDQTTAAASPSPLTWGETFVHMPSAYDAEDLLRNESPILTLDTDTDANADTATCGINFTTVWTNAGTVRDQYRSATDYLGAHAFLVALGFTTAAAHTALLPQTAAARNRDPASATDFPTAPSGGAANGLGNWAIEFRRPSILRLFGHAWEWAGFLNYSKSIPAAQKDLSPQNKFTYYFTHNVGGRVVPQGSNEDGFNVSPKGLEDIETGATLTVESVGNSTLDDFQLTDFPNGLTATEITVDNLTVNTSVQFPEVSAASTIALGPVRLATVGDIDNDTNAALNNAQLNASGDKAITLPGLNRWRQQRNLLSGAQAGATIVVLHVASGTPITGDNSVPFGYPTAGHTFIGEGAPGLRGRIFPTVTAALEEASTIFVPVGAEIVVSVHDQLTGIETGPLMLSNGTAPWVVLGARGATNPKIKLRRGTTANVTLRLPQYSAARTVIYSAGGIFGDIEVEIDMNNSGAWTTLSLDGGFAVGTRDCIVSWVNIGNGAELHNATCRNGSQINIRFYNASGNFSQLLTRYTPSSSSNTVDRFVFMGGDGGLLGNMCLINLDLRFGGGTGEKKFAFDHGYSAAAPIQLLRMATRGTVSITSRQSSVAWDFNGKQWDFGQLYGSGVTRVHISNGNIADGFRTIPIPSGGTALSHFGITDNTLATVVPITFTRGSTIDIGSESNKAGTFYSLLLALEDVGGLPAILLSADNTDGAYVFGGASARNLT